MTSSSHELFIDVNSSSHELVHPCCAIVWVLCQHVHPCVHADVFLFVLPFRRSTRRRKQR
jgi:hypothetical protein